MKTPKWLRGHLSPQSSQLTPGSKATCAIAIKRPKTAALCFDHVYTSDRTAPRGIAMDWMVLFDDFGKPVESSIIEVPPGLEVSVAPSEDALRRSIRQHPGTLMKLLTRRGVTPIPYYEDEGALKDDLVGEGGFQAIAVALENLNIVSEQELSWEQVIAFRADKESQHSYARFLQWFNLQTKDGASLDQVEYMIFVALDQYRESLRKHGIHTYVAPLGFWLMGPIAANSVIHAFLTYAGEPTPAWATGVTLTGGALTCLAKVRTAHLDRRTAKRAPLAYVHKLSNL